MKEKKAEEETDKKISKTWAFTLNNYSAAEEQQLKDLECTYIVFGHEIGENGTPHLQGTVTFKKSHRLTALKKLNNRISWSTAIGEECSANYCMKDKNYFLKDNRAQGTRTDLNEAAEIVRGKGKEGIEDCKTNWPTMYVKYHAGLEKLALKAQTQRDFKPYVEWIWGESGVGKTRYVWEKHDKKNIWAACEELKYWNGYENQEVILFDDFRGDWCKLATLLKILDRYPYTVNVKNGWRELNSKYIYITSCKTPSECYAGCGENIKQLTRRIDLITNLRGHGPSPLPRSTPSPCSLRLTVEEDSVGYNSDNDAFKFGDL